MPVELSIRDERNRAVKRSVLCGLLVVGSVTATSAQGRHWYWYRVQVTSVGTNHYRDKDSGVTIVTSGCGEVAKGTHARLMWSGYEGSWIAFDGGESCDVVDLVSAGRN